jgi:hypothetical protein
MKYKVFEVDPNGGIHLSKRIIELKDPRNGDHAAIITSLFNEYGFTQFTHYYKINSEDNYNTIKITYNYVVIGIKTTWILKLEEEESEND